MAFAGGLAGLLLAVWGVGVMTRLIPSSLGGAILSVEHPHVDATVLLFALAVSLLTGVLFGLAPALAATRPDLVEHWKDSAQASTAGGGRAWLRGSPAVAELSLALVVLIGAGLLIKSFYRLLSVNLGFAAEHVLTMNINLTDARYPQAGQKIEFFTRVLRKVETLPGVRSAALSDSMPLSPYRGRLMIVIPWLVPSPGSPVGSNMVQMNATEFASNPLNVGDRLAISDPVSAADQAKKTLAADVFLPLKIDMLPLVRNGIFEIRQTGISRFSSAKGPVPRGNEQITSRRRSKRFSLLHKRQCERMRRQFEGHASSGFRWVEALRGHSLLAKAVTSLQVRAS